MTTYQELMIEETPTEDLTMDQMNMLAQPFDSIEEDSDILGDILASFEGVGE